MIPLIPVQAIALIHLARKTQRVAIVPSWQDDTHYGDAIISMSLLFDLEGYREKVRPLKLAFGWEEPDAPRTRQTGTLVVEWKDVKELDEDQATTVTDTIGCYKGPNNCKNQLRFAHPLSRT